MLDICNHGRAIYIILLDGVLGSKGEERGSGPIIGEATRIVNRGNWLICDVLCPDVPSPRFPIEDA